MSRAKLFVKSLVVFTALALLGIALIETSLVMAAKLLAADLALSLLIPLFYPGVRGIKKGDSLMITKDAFPIFYASAKALSTGKKGDTIQVLLNDGSEGEALVEDYAGIFSPARIRLLQRQVKVQVV